MTPELPAALMREGLMLLSVVGAPLFGAVLLTGLVVGILQAATQVNDSAVGFLPRVVTAIAVCWLTGGWMMHRLSRFLGEAITRMSGH